MARGSKHPALTAAVSLQEAATWIRQAELALGSVAASDITEEERLQAEKDIEMLQKIGRNLKRIHNRYSRVKMG